METISGKRQKGQALLASIFILGLVMLLGSMSLSAISVTELQQKVSEASGDEALYIARAGTEEMLYRLSADSDYGSTQPETVVDSTLGNGAFNAVISGDSETRTITATGTVGNYQRKIEVVLGASGSSGNIALSYAAQAGTGGINMQNGSQIAGLGGGEGNVFSNGPIQGENTAKIVGNAWAVSGINPSVSGSTDMTITKNAYGSVINKCTVNGNTYSPALPTNCNVTGSKNITPAPTPLTMPEVDIAYWQNEAEEGGTIANYTQDSGTATLGPKKITGNLTLSNTATLTVTGALWVYGTVTVQNSAKMNLDENFADNGTVILLDHPTDKVNNGRFVIQNSGQVNKTTQGGYILFVSTNQKDDCSPATISISNNTALTAFIANDGCVQINNSGGLVALAAKKLNLAQGAQIEYETGLSTALYVPGPGIGGGADFGWSLSSWTEIP